MAVGEKLTINEVRKVVEDVKAKIDSFDMVPIYTIDDYPIGGRNRGKCQLTVEYRRRHGFRPVKQTTNKHGVWCKPKAGVYQHLGMIVVVGDFDGKEAAWLRLDSTFGKNVYVQFANGDCESLGGVPWTRVPEDEDERRAYMVWRGMMQEIHGRIESKFATREWTALVKD